MHTKHSAQQMLDARGPRWAVWVELGRDSAQVHYADTAARAEAMRDRHLEEWSQNPQRVQLHPPAESVDIAAAAAERAAAKASFDEKTAILKAVSLQAIEAGRAEAEVAREARVDRMTVRAWAGKR